MSGDDATAPVGPVRAVALSAFVVVTVVAIAGPVVTSLAGEPLWPNTAATVATYVFVLVGGLIAFRRPRNPIGWLCLLAGAAFALEGALWGVALYGFAHPGSVPLPEMWAIVGDAFVMPGLFLMATLLLLLFPDGRLPSPRWRWLARVTVALLLVSLLSGPFLPHQSGWGRPTLDNPMAVEAAEWVEFALVALFACVAASVVALIGRYRRSTGIERLQLRWLAAAGAGAVGIWVLAIFVVADPLGREDVAIALTVGGFSLVPVAIGVAVTRYRLFEIDRLISRTVTYGLVVAVLAGVYVTSVLVLGNLFPRQSDLGVAASTLVAAALFLPLRRRVQRGVERRFNRSRYDAERELERFAGRLRDELDLDGLTDDLLGVVATTLQPITAGVWIREAER